MGGLPDGPLLDAVREAAARAHAAQNDVSRLQEVADGKLARLQATHDAERALRRRAEAEVAVLGRCLRDAEAFHALREVQADVRAAKQAQQAQALRAVLEHQSRVAKEQRQEQAHASASGRRRPPTALSHARRSLVAGRGARARREARV